MKRQTQHLISDFHDGRGFNRFVNCIFAIIILCILVTICFFGSIAYPNQRQWYPNLLIICLIVPVLLLFSIFPSVSSELLKANRWKKWKILLILSLFVLQSSSVYCYYFYTGWDVSTIIPTSIALAHGEDTSGWAWYYSMCPNNLFLTSIFSGIIRILNALFPFTIETEAEYVSLLLIQCLLNQMTGVLIYSAAKNLFHRER
ncbi:MAG: hypothetical protein K5746_05085, partial [Clostridiales bacterium]|nr:hypothetical protein [Clostridiales bacterium]